MNGASCCCSCAPGRTVTLVHCQRGDGSGHGRTTGPLPSLQLCSGDCNTVADKADLSVLAIAVAAAVAHAAAFEV